MYIRKNQDTEQVKRIQEALRNNDGYCPCSIIKSKDTKCMCKDFRDKITNGYIGLCHCGLFESVNDEHY